jgi:transposase
MRIRKPRKTLEEKSEIHDAYNSELSIKQIVEKFRVSSATIYKIVREFEDKINTVSIATQRS